MIVPEDRAALIRLRIEQAEQSIDDAEYCLADDRRGVATNRVYYGMFYAMLALGLLRSFKSSKHHQMIGWFNKSFVHTGIMPAHFGRLVKDAFEARMDADYDVAHAPCAADLQTLIEDMKTFISTIKNWIEANPA